MLRTYRIQWRWVNDPPLTARIDEVVAPDSIQAEETLRSFLNLGSWKYDIVSTIPVMVDTDKETISHITMNKRRRMRDVMASAISRMFG